jgi:hypothetical protein
MRGIVAVLSPFDTRDFCRNKVGGGSESVVGYGKRKADYKKHEANDRK